MCRDLGFDINFHIYGKDSITALNTTFKRNLQALKQEYYPEILSIITSVKNDRLDEVNEIPEKWILSKQGYSYRINNKGIRLDSLFAINKSGNEHHIGNFKNVTINPNLYYFNLFQLLTKSLGIKVIYLNTPKSKFYLMGLKKVGNNKIWNSIKDSLKARQIELWDYENMNTDSLNFNYYLDEVHSSHKGAIFFTRIIRERLKK